MTDWMSPKAREHFERFYVEPPTARLLCQHASICDNLAEPPSAFCAEHSQRVCACGTSTVGTYRAGGRHRADVCGWGEAALTMLALLQQRRRQVPSEPRVETDRFVVYPSDYDDLVNSDKDSWCLSVVNGHAWGWRITRGRGMQSDMAMNRRGEFIVESRGSGHNKARRWPLNEALRIALEHIDTLRINGYTAAEASASVAARMARDAG